MHAETAHRLLHEPPVNIPAEYTRDTGNQARKGNRAARLNKKGIDMSLQLLADQMFFEYCEGKSIEQIAKLHCYAERTVRFLAGNNDWNRRRKKVLLGIQAAQADQFRTDQGTRARFFYARHGAMITAITSSGENIVMGYINRLREKGMSADGMSREEQKHLQELTLCLGFVEKVAKSAAITFAPVEHGLVSFTSNGGSPPPIETKNVDGTSKVSWAMTGDSLPPTVVKPNGGLIDKQSLTIDRIANSGIQVKNDLPESVRSDLTPPDPNNNPWRSK